MARGWRPQRYRRTVRQGVIEQMLRRTPDPHEPMTTTPAWAVDRANELAVAASAAIGATGVTVIGDLASLGAVTPNQPVAAPAALDLDAAVNVVIGAIDAAASGWQA